MKTSFSIRIDDLELRKKDGSMCEIVKWEPSHQPIAPYCFTVAMWTEPDRDGQSDLMFVGGRPFDVDSGQFLKLAKLGHVLMNNVKS